jgi:hypothetical protein
MNILNCPTLKGLNLNNHGSQLMESDPPLISCNPEGVE